MSSLKEIHLVVFVHGLWGNPSHLQYLVGQFEAKHGDSVHTLNAKNNSSKYTYDGINVCGDRLVEEIYAEVKSLQEKPLNKVTKFSIIGYSLGGLISRYAIGILYQQGFFKSIEPKLFTTFATPHLGIRREDSNILTKVINWVSSTLLSQTGEQLTFMDNYEGDEPILLTMSRPDKIFFKALSGFKSRKLYANTRNDKTVPFWSAAISEIDPFENFDELKLETNKKFRDIIESISKLESVQKISFVQRLKNTIKEVLRYILVGIAISIFLPLWIIFVLSTITVQGILSRRRVRKILAMKAKNLNNDNRSLSNNIGITDRATSLEEDAVETAMNIRNFLTPSLPTTPQSQSNPNPFENTTTLMSEFTTSSQFPHVCVCQAQCEAFANLNKLKWEKFAVFLDAFNAHAAIIMRNSLQTKGKEIIKHFVEEIFVV